MAPSWFAHSLSGSPEQAWEPLSRHLQEVARKTSSRAAKFGTAQFGEAAGLLHDLGKYKPEFQAYIRGKSSSPDHASAGANYAKLRLGLAGHLVAHAVAGHHAGLADGLFERDGRLDRRRAELAPIEASARADGLDLPQSLPTPTGFRLTPGERGFQLAFLTRMLFSCLVDADRSATRAFYAAAFGESADGPANAGMADLADALRRWMDKQAAARVAAGLADRPVNRLRAQVLAHALTAADQKPGAFTLTVPTGGGKTLTSLAFALEHARRHGLDRIIVAIPFTSVIEQTAEAYRTALPDYAEQILEHHSAFDESRITGRQGLDALKLAMESWDAPIVLTTAVQLFESLFSNRPSRCRKLHNLARSVIVLDEAQTVPLSVLRPCVAALRELVCNYGSSVVLCSATQPALQERPEEPARSFAGGFRAPVELAPEPTRLFAALRRVCVRVVGEMDDAALAARFAREAGVLCIVNQRRHARELSGLIRDLPGARHLSTCMHAARRSRVLAEIRADLVANRPCRVVATSLVEAGVDVDFPLVLRAEAGLDSVAQAAGRCNREGRRPASESEVLVFRAPDRPPPRELSANVEAGAEVLALNATDPLAPEAVEAYFRLLYWRKNAELDRHGILEDCEKAARSLDFPFESIGTVRLIEGDMAPVIVPKEDAGEAEKLLGELSFVPFAGRIARRLQRFTVGMRRGILEAIHWKPAIIWRVQRFYVLNTIRFESIRRNEGGSRVPAGKVGSAMRAGSTEGLALYVDEDRQQRAATVLRDVAYIIEARLDLTPRGLAAGDESVAKHLDMFRRRAERGQCFHRPYLGTREFACDFALLDSESPAAHDSLRGERDLGWMMLDLNFAAGMAPRFFHAIMRNGVIDVPALGDAEVAG